MRVPSGWAIIASVLLLSVPAFAAGAPAGSSSASLATKVAGRTGHADQSHATTENPHQIICRQSPPPVGSLLGGSTICHTREQWSQMSVDSQQQLNRMQMIGGAMGH